MFQTVAELSSTVARKNHMLFQQPHCKLWHKIYLTWTPLHDRSTSSHIQMHNVRIVIFSSRHWGKVCWLYTIVLYKWPTVFSVINQLSSPLQSILSPKLAFSLKFYPVRGKCVGEWARGECISKRTGHLSAQAVNSWWRRCKMYEQRLTGWKMTGNRFPFLSPLLQKKRLTIKVV